MIVLNAIRCPANKAEHPRLSLPGRYRLEPRSVVRFKGANGAGKTTLLRIISGIERDYAGDCIPDQGIAIRLVPTALDELLPPWTSVIDSARLLLKGAPDGLQALSEFKRLGAFFLPEQIARLENRATYRLSSGQRAAVACACALASSPKVIALDETLSFLADELRARIGSALRSFVDDGGLLILVGHIEKALMEIDQEIPLAETTGDTPCNG